MAAKPKPKRKAKRSTPKSKRATPRKRRATRKPGRRRLSNDLRLADLAAQISKKLRIARACYRTADELVVELLDAGAKHGDVFEIDGKLKRLVDNFRGVNKIFRTTAVMRWSLDDDGDA